MKKRLRMALAIILLVVAAPFLVMAIYVEDWSRDLTTNTAATAADHPDERLRPIEVDANAEEATTAAQAFCNQQAAWELVDEKPRPSDSLLAPMSDEDALTIHHLVRKTGLMGYRDDVWLVVEPKSDSTVRLHAESRSRVGKGDLGQNPRNLRELLAAMRERL